MAKINVIEFDDAANFLSYLRPSQDHWWSGPRSIDYVFRGLTNTAYELLPSAYRKPLHREFGLIVAAKRKQIPELDELGAIHYAILDVMESVVNVAKAVGIDIGNTELFGANPLTNIHLLALLQHYGVPTTLLDWTTSPLVAATFASRGDGTKDICVWAISKSRFVLPESIREDGGSLEVVIDDRRIIPNPYLRAQAGTFTYVMTSGATKADKLDSMPLETLHDFCAESALLKMVLRKSEVCRLQELIFRENLSMAHLMPDLNNVVEVGLQQCLSPRA